MKKQILSLIIILNLFALSAKTISREYTTDKETGDAVVIETYEGDENGLIERRLQGNTLPVASVIKDIYSSDNKYNYTYTITYNLNLATGFFDKKEFFYNENSLMEYSVATVKKEGDEYFVELDSDFKPNNIKNLEKAVETFTFGNSKLKSTLYYNQNKRLSQSYFEYDNNQITYVKSDYKTHPNGLIILKNYYSYPDYPYENNPHGLLKLVHTENPDGTYFHEYYLDITKRSTLFTKYVSKYSEERKELYSEQYYEKQLYKGKVYRIIEYRDENASVISTLYYDKDGNEIPKSELGIPEQNCVLNHRGIRN